MIATLTFTLPEDKIEYKMAQSASDLYCTLFDTREELVNLRSDCSDEDVYQRLSGIIANISDAINGIE